MNGLRLQYGIALCQPLLSPTSEILETADGSGAKKPRTQYSPKQLLHLEESFLQNQFPSLRERGTIAQELELTQQHVQVWFQNRRAKNRRKRKKTIPVDQRNPKPPPFWPQHLPFDSNFIDATKDKNSVKPADASPSALESTNSKGEFSPTSPEIESLPPHTSEPSTPVAQLISTSSPHSSNVLTATNTSPTSSFPTASPFPDSSPTSFPQSFPTPSPFLDSSSPPSHLPVVSSNTHIPTVPTQVNTYRPFIEDCPPLPPPPPPPYLPPFPPPSSITASPTAACRTTAASTKTQYLESISSTAVSLMIKSGAAVSIAGNSGSCRPISLPNIHSFSSSSVASSFTLATCRSDSAICSSPTSRKRRSTRSNTPDRDTSLSSPSTNSQPNLLDLVDSMDNAIPNLSVANLLPSPIYAEDPVALAGILGEEWDIPDAIFNIESQQMPLLHSNHTQVCSPPPYTHHHPFQRQLPYGNDNVHNYSPQMPRPLQNGLLHNAQPQRVIPRPQMPYSTPDNFNHTIPVYRNATIPYHFPDGRSRFMFGTGDGPNPTH